MSLDAKMFLDIVSQIPAPVEKFGLSDYLIQTLGTRITTGHVLQIAMKYMGEKVEVIAMKYYQGDEAYLQGNKLCVSTETFAKLKQEETATEVLGSLRIQLFPHVDLSGARILSVSLT